MSRYFFSGSTSAKLDDKNRCVLPQAMRYGLVENGELNFTIALGLGGCLTIYRKSAIDAIIEKFQSKQHVAKFQKFFTLFFSTLHHTSCDKLGRVVIPGCLKKAVGLNQEIVIAGVLDKIEIWPADRYQEQLSAFMDGEGTDEGLDKMMEEAFALLSDEAPKPSETPVETLKSLV